MILDGGGLAFSSNNSPSTQPSTPLPMHRCQSDPLNSPTLPLELRLLGCTITELTQA